jgi:hypothetical protein
MDGCPAAEGIAEKHPAKMALALKNLQENFQVYPSKSGYNGPRKCTFTSSSVV